MSNPVAQVHNFAVTTPAATQVASPLTTHTRFDDGYTVEWIEVDVPAGLDGLAGFAILSSLSQVIPFTTGATRNWLVLNDVTLRWDFTGLPDTGDWSVLSYNLGNYPHTVYVRYGLSLPPAGVVVPPPVVLLPAASLSGVLA